MESTGAAGSERVSLARDALEEGLRTLLARPIGDAELDENTRVVAAPPKSRDRSARVALVARLADERIAFDVGFARRVTAVSPPHRVPHRMHDAFAGIASVGGDLMLVARLERLFDLPRGAVEPGERRFVVLGEEGRAWAVEVDRVEGVRRFDASQILAPPATVGRALDGLTESLVEVHDGASLISLLSTDRLKRALERCLA